MKPLPPTYGEAFLKSVYGYSGSFFSKHINSLVPIYEIEESDPTLDKRLEIVIQNIRSVLDENPEDIEFDLYTPLCDTAIYYFIEDVEEYDDSDYYEEIYSKYDSAKFEVMSTEDLSFNLDDEEDEDCLTEEGLNFWEHCVMIVGIKLKPLDCLQEN